MINLPVLLLAWPLSKSVPYASVMDGLDIDMSVCIY